MLVIHSTEIRHKRQEIQEVPTEADLEKIVDITLTETETIWMFDLPDVKISTESEEVHDIEKRNKSYAEVNYNHRIMSVDHYYLCQIRLRFQVFMISNYSDTF